MLDSKICFLLLILLNRTLTIFSYKSQWRQIKGKIPRTLSSVQDDVADKPKKLADQIQDAGGVRNFIVDELMKDRTEEGDALPGAQRDPGLEEPLVLSPAAKERLRKSEELNAQVVKAVRSAGIIIVGSCVALLYLAKESGLTQ